LEARRTAKPNQMILNQLYKPTRINAVDVRLMQDILHTHQTTLAIRSECRKQPVATIVLLLING